jgi:hypothetical protein
MKENPYDPPRSPSKDPRLPVSDMGMLVRSAFFVLATGGGGAILGLAVGACLGVLAPDYYRSVFAGGDRPGFDPLSVGVGLGVSQGAFVGVIAGLVLVVAFYWYKLRKSKL